MDLTTFKRDPRSCTLSRVLEFAALEHGESPFLRMSGSDEWLTHAGALRSARQVAGALKALGVGHGDYVPVMLPNGIEYALSWFAVNLLGAAYVGINTSMVGELLANQFATTPARTCIVHADYLPVLDRLPAALPATLDSIVVVGLAPDASAGTSRLVRFESLVEAAEPFVPSDATQPLHSDVCTLGFTSGTTGPSKAVMVPHSHAIVTALNFIRHVGLVSEDVLYSPFPLFHGMSSRMGLLPALLVGCRVVLGRRFSGTRFWTEVIEADATVAQIIFSVPPVLLAQPPSPNDRAHRVTRMMNAHYNEAFEQRFGVQLIEAFAMSEIGAVISTPYGERRPGAAGRVHPDWEVELMDEDGNILDEDATGEIVCRPRKPGLMMLGYFNQPERTVEATRGLWFHTGDIARRDADGYFWFLDRARERIRRRGENISSLEIEELVKRHPDLADAAVVAHPASAGEDDIRLLIVPNPGSLVLAHEIHGWMRDHMPRFMVARYIEIVSSLPYTATNKVEKNRIIAMGLGLQVWDAEEGQGSAP